MSRLIDAVKATIASHKVVVYSKVYCPYCTKAKTSLGTAGAKGVHVIELDELDEGADIQAVLPSITGIRTVPQVFIGGKFIGGGDDTAALLRSGKLKELLASVGAL